MSLEKQILVLEKLSVKKTVLIFESEWGKNKIEKYMALVNPRSAANILQNFEILHR